MLQMTLWHTDSVNSEGIVKRYKRKTPLLPQGKLAVLTALFAIATLIISGSSNGALHYGCMITCCKSPSFLFPQELQVDTDMPMVLLNYYGCLSATRKSTIPIWEQLQSPAQSITIITDTESTEKFPCII